jgi:hypothetical protein
MGEGSTIEQAVPAHTYALSDQHLSASTSAFRYRVERRKHPKAIPKSTDVFVVYFYNLNVNSIDINFTMYPSNSREYIGPDGPFIISTSL